MRIVCCVTANDSAPRNADWPPNEPSATINVALCGVACGSGFRFGGRRFARGAIWTRAPGARLCARRRRLFWRRRWEFIFAWPSRPSRTRELRARNLQASRVAPPSSVQLTSQLSRFGLALCSESYSLRRSLRRPDQSTTRMSIKRPASDAQVRLGVAINSIIFVHVALRRRPSGLFSRGAKTAPTGWQASGDALQLEGLLQSGDKEKLRRRLLSGRATSMSRGKQSRAR